MGAVPSTPRRSTATRPQDTEEYLIGTFVDEKSFPLASDFWQKLLELPLSLQWPPQRASEACEVFGIPVWEVKLSSAYMLCWMLVPIFLCWLWLLTEHFMPWLRICDWGYFLCFQDYREKESGERERFSAQSTQTYTLNKVFNSV